MGRLGERGLSEAALGAWEGGDDFGAGCLEGRSVVRESLETIILLLSPIVPHICHELWKKLNYKTSLIDEKWPNADKLALAKDSIEIVVQVNGKLRSRIIVDVNADEEKIKSLVIKDKNVQRYIGKNKVKNIIIVPGRLVNVVV